MGMILGVKKFNKRDSQWDAKYKNITNIPNTYKLFDQIIDFINDHYTV